MNYMEFTSLLLDQARKKGTLNSQVALSAYRFPDVGPLPTDGDVNGALLRIAQALPTIRDPYEASRLALLAGYLVERGGDAGLVGIAIAEQMEKVLPQIDRAMQSSDIDGLQQRAMDLISTDELAASAVLGIEPLIAAAVGIWAVDRNGLRVARKSAAIQSGIEQAVALTPMANFLRQLLDGSDQELMVFLDPVHQRGLSIVADNVRNGFQLFTLFEGLLTNPNLPFSYPSLDIAEIDFAIASGDSEPDGDHNIQAHFDYFNWSAWSSTGWIDDAPTRWVWGELPLPCIPLVKDKIVVLFDNAKYIRTWDARIVTRVHPTARSSVQLQSVLADEEVSRLLAMIAGAPASIRNQMKYAGVRF